MKLYSITFRTPSSINLAMKINKWGLSWAKLNPGWGRARRNLISIMPSGGLAKVKMFHRGLQIKHNSFYFENIALYIG